MNLGQWITWVKFVFRKKHWFWLLITPPIANVQWNLRFFVFLFRIYCNLCRWVLNFRVRPNAHIQYRSLSLLRCSMCVLRFLKTNKCSPVQSYFYRVRCIFQPAHTDSPETVTQTKSNHGLHPTWMFWNQCCAQVEIICQTNENRTAVNERKEPFIFVASVILSFQPVLRIIELTTSAFRVFIQCIPSSRTIHDLSSFFLPFFWFVCVRQNYVYFTWYPVLTTQERREDKKKLHALSASTQKKTSSFCTFAELKVTWMLRTTTTTTK